jgi:hypothetical protein
LSAAPRIVRLLTHGIGFIGADRPEQHVTPNHMQRHLRRQRVRPLAGRRALDSVLATAGGPE